MTRTRTGSTTDWEMRVRRVHFDWDDAPLHWLPDDPFASHVINQFSFTLVKGEGFFCRVFAKAQPLIEDARLRDDVETFIRQEAIHAGAHKGSIDKYLARYDKDTGRNFRPTTWLFEKALTDSPLGLKLPKALTRPWLVFRVGLVAAAEHFTCAISTFALRDGRWVENGADPVVADLFSWHCAEEIEHRSVAYDLYRHLGGGYLGQIAAIAIMAPLVATLMLTGTARFAQADPALPGAKSVLRPSFWRLWRRSVARRNIPSLGWFARTTLRYMRPGYHPRDESSTQLAHDYVSRSPGVRAQAERQGQPA